jgi:uncharacterized protein
MRVAPTGISIIRRSSLVPTPWKNGGGITHEVLRVPGIGDPFQWRVSLAQIAAAGPFSDFSGYTRTMVLLRGRGLVLKFAQGEEKRLVAVGDLVRFDGAASVECELLDGPCEDLNLIANNTLQVDARVERSNSTVEVAAMEGETALVVGIDGPLMLEDSAGGTHRLEPKDVGLLTGTRVRVRGMGSDAAAAPSAALLAVVRPGRA